eukprot:m.71386 g.71386  ORF g.71386 m.71386 type:complete len:436 (-) comp24344_c0_seq1:161-1468(-)
MSMLFLQLLTLLSTLMVGTSFKLPPLPNVWLKDNITCPDKILVGYSIYQGSVITAQAQVVDEGACCALCHGDYHDECVGWQYINLTTATSSSTSSSSSSTHNCDIMAKNGPPVKVAGRVAGFVGNVPPTPPPSPPQPQQGTPCNSDGDCEKLWGTTDWRCLNREAIKSPANNCHMHALQGNTTCACQPSGCVADHRILRSGIQHLQQPALGDSNRGAAHSSANVTKYLVIGDSISEGFFSDLGTLMTPYNWSLTHNQGNGDNTNFGAHCVPTWVGSNVYDVISFQFGLHDIAFDEERVSVEQYSALLTNITQFLVNTQKQHGTKLLWVKTTPVPTVPTYGPTCQNDTTCLNPPRFDSDVRLYNTAADNVIALANKNGAKIDVADLYSFVVEKCGGQGYSKCPGFQLPNNVHFYEAGWNALADEMKQILLAATVSV